MAAEKGDQSVLKRLMEQKLVTAEQIKKAQAVAEKHPKKPSVLQVLVSQKIITKDDVAAAKAGGGAKPKPAPSGGGGLDFADDDDEPVKKPSAGLAFDDDDDDLPAPSSGGGSGLAFDDDDDLPEPAAKGKAKAGGKKGGPAKKGKGPSGMPDLDSLPDRPQELGKRKPTAFIAPLVGLVVLVGAIAFLMGGSGDGDKDANTNGTAKTDKNSNKKPSKNSDTGNDNGPSIMAHAEPGIESGATVRVVGEIIEIQNRLVKIRSPFAADGDDPFNINLYSDPRRIEFLSNYADDPGSFAGKLVEFEGDLRMSNNRVFINKAKLVRPDFAPNQSPKFDIFTPPADDPVVDTSRPTNSNTNSNSNSGTTNGGNSGSTNSPDSGDPNATATDPNAASSEAKETLGKLESLGPRDGVPHTNEAKQKEWEAARYQLSKLRNDPGLLSLVVKWCEENPAPPMPDGLESPDIPSFNDLWRTMLEYINGHRGRYAYRERVKKIFVQAFPRLPIFVAGNINNAVGDQNAVMELSDFLLESDAEEMAPPLKQMRQAVRSTMIAQMSRMRDSAEARAAMQKLVASPYSFVANQAMNWLVTLDPASQIPALVKWLVSGERDKENVAIGKFRDFSRQPNPQLKQESLRQLRPHATSGDDIRTRIKVVDLMLALERDGSQDVFLDLLRDKEFAKSNAAREVEQMLGRYYSNDVESFGSQLATDTSVGDRYRKWALENLRLNAERRGADAKERYLQTVISMLKNTNDTFNPHETLKGMCQNRADLFDTFGDLLKDKSRQDGDDLIERLYECDMRKAVDAAVTFAQDKNSPPGPRARTLMWISRMAKERLDATLQQLRTEEAAGNMPKDLQDVLRRLRLTVELDKLVTAGGLSDAIKKIGNSPQMCAGNAESYTIVSTYRDDVVLTVDGGGERISVVKYGRRGEESNRAFVERRDMHTAYKRFEVQHADWAASPTADPNAEPEWPRGAGVSPTDARVAHAFLGNDTTVLVLTATGVLEEWDLNSRPENPYFENQRLPACKSTKDLTSSLKRAFRVESVGEIDRSQISVAVDGRSAAISFPQFGIVAFIDVARGSLDGFCKPGPFLSLSMSADGKRCMFMGNGPLRLCDVRRDAEVTPLEIEGEVFQAYWGFRDAQIYIPQGQAIRVFDAKSGAEMASLVPSLDIDQNYRLQAVKKGEYLIETNGDQMNIRQLNEDGQLLAFVASVKMPGTITQVEPGTNGKNFVVCTTTRAIDVFEVK